MRYFLELSYDGLPFHGWQRQPNAVTVQELLEDSLATILRTPTSVTGAGRTDTGVHARKMYAHFDSNRELKDEKLFLRSLNRLVGRSIAIHRLFHVADDAHARFDAIERTYKYFVIFDKCPFLRHYSWLSPSHLDIVKMNEASLILTRTEDFTSFAKLHSDVKTNICKVRKAQWDIFDNNYEIPGMVFTISADRFLRNMVRAIVGTLVEVGRGKMTVEEFEEVILKADRCAAGTSMPPEGLFLWDVKYKYI